MNQFVLIKDLSIFMKHFYPPEDWENRINPGFYKWNYCDFTAVTKFIRETCEIRIYSDLIPEKQWYELHDGTIIYPNESTEDDSNSSNCMFYIWFLINMISFSLLYSFSIVIDSCLLSIVLVWSTFMNSIVSFGVI